MTYERREGVLAPKSFWIIPKKDRKGGCGPGRFGDILVPDTVWGLSIKLACQIHDYSYSMGETIQDKINADRNFLDNMLDIIETGSKWLRVPRQYRAMTYYLNVRNFGSHAFWKGKERR